MDMSCGDGEDGKGPSTQYGLAHDKDTLSTSEKSRQAKANVPAIPELDVA
jgi:hypothetical protein